MSGGKAGRRSEKGVERSDGSIHVRLQEVGLEPDVGSSGKSVFDQDPGRVVGRRRDRSHDRFRNDAAKDLVEPGDLVRLEADAFDRSSLRLTIECRLRAQTDSRTDSKSLQPSARAGRGNLRRLRSARCGNRSETPGDRS